jgi:hypothetical protein
VAADHHHHGGVVDLADLGERLQPVHPRHLDVHEGDVGAELAEDLDGLEGAAGGAHLVVFVFEQLVEDAPDPLLVVHHKDAGH